MPHGLCCGSAKARLCCAPARARPFYASAKVRLGCIGRVNVNRAPKGTASMFYMTSSPVSSMFTSADRGTAQEVGQ